MRTAERIVVKSETIDFNCSISCMSIPVLIITITSTLNVDLQAVVNASHGKLAKIYQSENCSEQMFWGQMKHEFCQYKFSVRPTVLK